MQKNIFNPLVKQMTHRWLAVDYWNGRRYTGRMIRLLGWTTLRVDLSIQRLGLRWLNSIDHFIVMKIIRGMEASWPV